MDIQTSNHGTLIGLTPLTVAGQEWIADNLPDATSNMLGTTVFCEPRYAGDIVDGMRGDGLGVE